MSTEPLVPPSTPAAPASPPAAAPAPTTPAANSPPSLVGSAEPAPTAWAEYVPDPAKSEADNAAAKAAHDATKPAEAPKAPAAEVKPLTPADVKLPEGFAIDEPVMNEFLGIVNDPKMSAGDRAQALVDLQVKSATQASERASEAWTTMMTEWQDEVRSDPAVGGAKFDASVATANSIVDRFGGPALAQLCATTGIGNNVHFVKFLNTIAPKLVEAAQPVPGTPPSTSSSPDAVAARMFPTMAPKG